MIDSWKDFMYAEVMCNRVMSVGSMPFKVFFYEQIMYVMN